MRGAAQSILALDEVSVRRSVDPTAPRQLLLDRVSWRVEPGEQWAVLGPNGAGKTTLLRVAAGLLAPTWGTVTILGGRSGRVNLPALRHRIAFAAREPTLRFRPTYTVEDVVLTGATGTADLLPEAIGPGKRERAAELLELVGVDHVSRRPYGACSDGERARALIARSLLTGAELVALDEPGAGLDLPARELLVGVLARLREADPSLAMIVATHHLEELPPTLTHALLLRGGRVVAAGAIDEVVNDETARLCFGMPIRIERFHGRLFARAL